MDNNTTVSKLDALLKAERQALISGDFDAIARFFDEKQALLEQMEHTMPERGILEPLREKLRRNHELFNQALAGLRNVANRIGDVSRVRRVLNTYDAKGRARKIDAPGTPLLERRA